MHTFIIDGMGPGFDGLVVETSPETLFLHEDTRPFRAVTRVIGINSVIGDRSPAFLVPDDGLIVSARYLKPYDVAMRQFDHRNHLGQYQFEGRFISGDIEVAYAQYQNALAVTVLQRPDKLSPGTRTIASKYFYGDFEKWLEVIKETMSGPKAHPDDIVFALMGNKEG